MKDKKIKKRTLTISTPTKKNFDASNFTTSGKKKSFIVEKTFYRKRVEKNFVSPKQQSVSNKINDLAGVEKKKDFFKCFSRCFPPS